MTKTGKLTPVVIAKAIQENMNANGTLRSQFKTHLLGKFSDSELEGIKSGIEAEINGRNQAVVDEKIKFLNDMGYTVSKK
ncbi:hypothetical protein ACFLR1_01795 [Bacteroidota bacterium]